MKYARFGFAAGCFHERLRIAHRFIGGTEPKIMVVVIVVFPFLRRGATARPTPHPHPTPDTPHTTPYFLRPTLHYNPHHVAKSVELALGRLCRRYLGDRCSHCLTCSLSRSNQFHDCRIVLPARG